MKKQLLSYFFLFIVIKLFSQKDSIHTNESYWEDQLYINVTYNILNNQPNDVNKSTVSYGFGFGYIKDIPLNKSNTFALGLGMGYNYDLYNHSLVFEDDIFTTDIDVSLNRFKTHNLEFPLQIRWRTSDAVTYSFWRVYLGVKFNYNLYNKFFYEADNVTSEYKNIDDYNSFQTGLELSAGYRGFNFYVYYGLSPIYNDSALFNGEIIETRALKLGLIFYLL